MIINRGQADDFNNWAQRGNRGWGYADLLPYFKRFERRIGDGDDIYRGRDGKIPVTDLDSGRTKSAKRSLPAPSASASRATATTTARRNPGWGYLQRSIDRGLRRSAGRMYLLPARKASKRIDLRTRARAFKIVFEGKKAVAVRYVDERNRAVHEVKVRKEVIVSGGTVNSPRLLQLSGVGSWPPSAKPRCGSGARPAGGRRKFPRPLFGPHRGAGEKFAHHQRDHPRTGLGRPDFALARRPAERDRREPVAPPIASGSPIRTSAAPISRLVFSPASYKEGFVGMLDDYPGMSCGVWQHRPESIGYVRAKSTDIFVDPAIQPNYLSHEIDQRALVGGIKLARRLLQTPELSRFRRRRNVSRPGHSHRKPPNPALGPPIWRHGLGI